ncbi:MAG: class I SAM-dependent methyltransferase [Pseudomonadales bacterium]
MNDKLWKYLRYDKKDVKGWLQRVDAEIIGSILDFQSQQSITGSCVEIGIHHGKSFIPLCMALEGEELALCIDIFDDQSKNLDSSGKGDFSSFQANLDKFHIDPILIRVFKGSSEDINHEQILHQVGPVRFFSVDGGHWKSIVQNDLRLAEKTLARDGVIALDDYCRAEWPEVTTGYTLWQEKTESDIIPFAVGSNKLFLCRRDFAATYRAALKTPFLVHYFSTSYRSEDGELDCYRVELVAQDEERMKGVFAAILKIFRPGLFVALMVKIRRNQN